MRKELNLRLLAHRMWRWRISTRAWWIDLARPSLNTCVCKRRSRKSCRSGRGHRLHIKQGRGPVSPLASEQAHNPAAAWSHRARRDGADGCSQGQHNAVTVTPKDCSLSISSRPHGGSTCGDKTAVAGPLSHTEAERRPRRCASGPSHQG
eukprot:2740702-Pleurochrysis_carterae.AAC.1